MFVLRITIQIQLRSFEEGRSKSSQVKSRQGITYGAWEVQFDVYMCIYIWQNDFFLRVKNTARLCSFFYLPPLFPSLYESKEKKRKKRWKVFHPSNFFQSSEFRVLFRIDLIWSDLIWSVLVCVRAYVRAEGKQRKTKRKRKWSPSHLYIFLFSASCNIYIQKSKITIPYLQHHPSQGQGDVCLVEGKKGTGKRKRERRKEESAGSKVR